MPREADRPEDYQIQSTHKSREDVISRIGKFLKADWNRTEDRNFFPHSRVLRYRTLDEAIAAFSRAGFEIVYRDATCQMKRASGFGGGRLSASAFSRPA